MSGIDVGLPSACWEPMQVMILALAGMHDPGGLHAEVRRRPGALSASLLSDC